MYSVEHIVKKPLQIVFQGKNLYLGTLMFGKEYFFSMELKDQTEKEISFSVCVSKGGVVQDPNRTIFLRLVNGVWEVVNEGY